MPSSLSSDRPIVTSASAPSIDPQAVMADHEQWIWLNRNNGRFYEIVDSEWVLIGAGISVDLTESHVKITHIKVVNGIITELETS